MNTREITDQLTDGLLEVNENDDNTSISTELNELLEMYEEKLEPSEKLFKLLTEASIYYKDGFDKFVNKNPNFAQSYFDIFNIMKLQNPNLLNQDTFKAVAQMPKELSLIFDYITRAHIYDTLNRTIFNVVISQVNYITQAKAEGRLGSALDLHHQLEAIIANNKNQNQDNVSPPSRKFK